MPEMIAVSSSNIEAIGYDETGNDLFVRFKGGATYKYNDVPLEDYASLLTAESVGKEFATKIKNQYEYEKVGGND